MCADRRRGGSRSTAGGGLERWFGGMASTLPCGSVCRAVHSWWAHVFRCPGIPPSAPAQWRGPRWWRILQALDDERGAQEPHPQKNCANHAKAYRGRPVLGWRRTASRPIGGEQAQLCGAVRGDAQHSGDATPGHGTACLAHATGRVIRPRQCAAWVRRMNWRRGGSELVVHVRPEGKSEDSG